MANDESLKGLTTGIDVRSNSWIPVEVAKATILGSICRIINTDLKSHSRTNLTLFKANAMVPMSLNKTNSWDLCAISGVGA